jgi:hypothetical protein
LGRSELSPEAEVAISVLRLIPTHASQKSETTVGLNCKRSTVRNDRMAKKRAVRVVDWHAHSSPFEGLADWQLHWSVLALATIAILRMAGVTSIPKTLTAIR